MNNPLNINPEPAHEVSRLPLLYAVKNGDYNDVCDLLNDNYKELNETDNNGSTPLWWAAYKGYNSIVNLLLEMESVDINSRNCDGLTPFLAAIEENHTSTVRILIEAKNIDVNISDNEDYSALFYVTSFSGEDMAEVLVSSGKISTYETVLFAFSDDSDSKHMLLTATDSPTPLYWASYNGYGKVVKMILDRGDVDTLDYNWEDASGRTALLWAVEKQHRDVIQHLVKSERIDVNHPDKKGRTPLRWACEMGRKDIVDLLISTGRVNIAQQSNGVGGFSYYMGHRHQRRRRRTYY
ncbi:unnamed protein product [Clonostachys rhizophaga]|uniref:Uncharacterized protein n=1 Tax=Clonostachys rhizophaga TaxID=160324 RepID=A0A9N9YKG9_9HYPO|nr:unnamed protein product [Clonostachys rhizophaga]